MTGHRTTFQFKFHETFSHLRKYHEMLLLCKQTNMYMLYVVQRSFKCMCFEAVYFNTFPALTLKLRIQSWSYHNVFCYMFTMNVSHGFMLQEIHSHMMLAMRSARRTVTMTCPLTTVHRSTREPGGTVTVLSPT